MPQSSPAPSHNPEPARNGLSQGSNGAGHGKDWLDDVILATHLAAKRAHLVAYQTGTGVLYRREDGAVGIFKPDPAMYEDLIPPHFEDEQIWRYESVES